VDAMLTLIDKLKVIEATSVLGVDLLWLNGNYQRALFHQVRKSSVTRLRELAEPRRRAALVCFLWQSYRDAVDQAVDMFDKLLTRASTQAQNELDEQLRRQRQTIQVSDALTVGDSPRERDSTVDAGADLDNCSLQSENYGLWVLAPLRALNRDPRQRIAGCLQIACRAAAILPRTFSFH
jgi:hypothetical protein